MAEHPAQPPGLYVHRTRVYFDPESGHIVHVHRLASPEPLDDARIEEELAIFEESVQRRHGVELDSIDVDEADFEASVGPDVSLRVDVARRALVTETTGQGGASTIVG